MEILIPARIKYHESYLHKITYGITIFSMDDISRSGNNTLTCIHEYLRFISMCDLLVGYMFLTLEKMGFDVFDSWYFFPRELYKSKEKKKFLYIICFLTRIMKIISWKMIIVH